MTGSPGGDDPRGGGGTGGGEKAGDAGAAESSGPVPVRDLMQVPTPEPEAEGDPRWEGGESAFELDGEDWLALTAGAGSYGTGDHGAARLLAIHFYRASAPDRPVREALLPAGLFADLWPDQLRALFRSATPIELDE
jgi:hypothetical protein